MSLTELDYQDQKSRLTLSKGRSPWWTLFVRLLAYFLLIFWFLLAGTGILLICLSNYYRRLPNYLRLLPHKHRLPIPDLSGG